MIIKKLNELSNEDVKKIRELERICKQADGIKTDISLDNEMKFDGNLRNFILGYEDNNLVSAIAMFVPTKSEGEISALTYPDFRRKGYFKKLLEEAFSELLKYNVREALFVTDRESESGKAAAEALKGVYEFTEYEMSYTGCDTSKCNTENVTLKLLDMENADEAIKASCVIYNEEYEDAKIFLVNSISSAERDQYALWYKDRIIGIGALTNEEDRVGIFGLGIIPEMRGKGYGRTILYKLIEEVPEDRRDSIFLEVDSKNDRAYKLYSSSGFKDRAATDYYRRKI